MSSKLLTFPSNPLAVDTEARARALDTRASFIVEAPAGSGKTGLIVQRFLKLLLDEDLQQPEEVIAITFTKKATAELLQRVLEELQAAQFPPVGFSEDGDDFKAVTRRLAVAVLVRNTERNWRILENPHRLNIRSIDSVCSGIASSVPLLSGAGGPRALLEDARPLYNAAAHRTFLQLGGPDQALHSALRNVLLHRDGNLRDAESLLASMLAGRELWGELVPLDSASLSEETLDTVVRARLEKVLEDTVCEGLTRATRLMPAGALQRLTALVHQWSGEPGYDGESPIAFCAQLPKAPGERAEFLDHWKVLINILLKKERDGWRSTFNSNHVRFSMPKDGKASLKQLIAEIESDELHDALCAVRELPPASYPEDQWQVAKSLFHVLRRALAELQVLFAERAECDFAELSLAAREALRSDSSVSDIALSAGGRLRHLLVDEMQDTSTGQYELLELLTKSWDGHTQTLFLVGDPKQSIYAFRKAEVTRFMRTMREEKLGDLPLEDLQLNANFRSQATLVKSFNEIFDSIFPKPDAESSLASIVTDVPFAEATPTLPATFHPGLHWHTIPLRKEASGVKPSLTNHQTAEAKNICGIIAEWRAKPLPADRKKPWRIAVLAGTRKQLATIATELKSAEIPYQAVEVESLAERQEVLDALALTRALLHPADRIAWLAVLHAPWCGLGLADLLALTGEGATADRYASAATLLAQNIDAISAEGQALLARAWPVLATAAETLGRTALSIQTERTWRSLGGDAMLTPEALLNVTRFFATLQEVESLGEGRVDLGTLNARLAALYAEPGGTHDDVQLMTIHKAKGLEWDVVLVPGLERQPASNRGELLNWLEIDAERGAQIVLAPIAGKGEGSSALTRWLSNIKASREAIERKRVFYVACTRAREELHLFAALTPNAENELKPRAGSLLKACWPAAAPHFTELLRSAAEASDGVGAPYLAPDSWEDSGETLALAASVESAARRPVFVARLPLEFQPRARFANAQKLPYPAAAALPQAPAFDRPEGSFAARAFGNVVHRYLQWLTTLIAEGQSFDVTTWQPRLLASLRAEGLPPSLAAREAGRALKALGNTLADVTGRWILAAHPQGASESSLTTTVRTLRADRTFLAGTAPPLAGNNTLWIIDFKTTEQGSRSDDAFAAAEIAKYRQQLESYAALLQSTAQNSTAQSICLGLFYPLKPRLIHWESATNATP